MRDEPFLKRKISNYIFKVANARLKNSFCTTDVKKAIRCNRPADYIAKSYNGVHPVHR